jgi:hypothetical protein
LGDAQFQSQPGHHYPEITGSSQDTSSKCWDSNYHSTIQCYGISEKGTVVYKNEVPTEGAINSYNI